MGPRPIAPALLNIDNVIPEVEAKGKSGNMGSLVSFYVGLPTFLRYWLPFIIVFLIVWALQRLSRPRGKLRHIKLAAFIGLLAGFIIGMALIVAGIAWMIGVGTGVPV
jgi:hypothetical protein